MKILKKLGLLVLAVVMSSVLLLTGCGSLEGDVVANDTAWTDYLDATTQLVDFDLAENDKRDLEYTVNYTYEYVSSIKELTQTAKVKVDENIIKYENNTNETTIGGTAKSSLTGYIETFDDYSRAYVVRNDWFKYVKTSASTLTPALAIARGYASYLSLFTNYSNFNYTNGMYVDTDMSEAGNYQTTTTYSISFSKELVKAFVVEVVQKNTSTNEIITTRHTYEYSYSASCWMPGY